MSERNKSAVGALAAGTAFFLLSNPQVLIPGFQRVLIYYLATIALGMAALRRLRNIRIPTGVGIFLILCCGSAAWSISRSTTLNATLLYALLALGAVWLAAAVPARTASIGIAFATVAIAVTSWVHALFSGLNPLTATTRLVGIGGNPNILAYTLALGGAFLLSLSFNRATPVLPQGIAWLLIVFTMYATRSASGYISLLILAAVGASIAFFRHFDLQRRQHLRRLALASLLVLAIGGYTLVNIIASWLGKNAETFTGRMDFWLATIRVAQDKALLGWGWGAVWTHPWQLAPSNKVATSIYQEAGRVLTHGHNSLLDIIPQLGLVGAASATVIVAYLLRNSYRVLTAAPPGSGVAATGLCIGLIHVVIGVTEPLFVIPLGFFTLVLADGYIRQQQRTQALDSAPAGVIPRR